MGTAVVIRMDVQGAVAGIGLVRGNQLLIAAVTGQSRGVRGCSSRIKSCDIRQMILLLLAFREW